MRSIVLFIAVVLAVIFLIVPADAGTKRPSGKPNARPAPRPAPRSPAGRPSRPTHRVPPSPPPRPPSRVPLVRDDQFYNDILDVHNRARSQFGLAPLSWDDRLASLARDIAENGNYMQHTGCDCGQNLWGGRAGRFTAASMVDYWLSESQEYNYVCDPIDDNNWDKIGHYSQVGCAIATRPELDREYLVCNYYPAGNVNGQRPFNC